MSKLFKKTVLYIVRTDKLRNYKQSAPCNDCLNIIKLLNLKKIVYSCDNNKFAVCKPTEYSPVHVHYSLGRRYINERMNK